MALLWMDSFDHYQTDEVDTKWTSANYEFVLEVGQGRCGSNALRLGTHAGVGRGINFGPPPPGVQTGILGFAYRIKSEYTLPNMDWTIVSLESAVTNEAVATVVYRADGSLTLHGAPGEVGRTLPNLVQFDRWVYLEMKVVLDNTIGTLALRVNNVQHINVTGINTVVSSSALLRRLYFVGGINHNALVDDLYVLDGTGPAPWNSFLGDCRVEYLRPIAAGPRQEFSRVGADANWQAVDDAATPDEDTSYVQANTPGLTDINLYQPTGLPSGTIYGAQLSLYARKSDPGPRIIAPVVNGIVGPSYAPGNDNYQYFSTPYATNPVTGSPWTIATINVVQAGVTVVS